MKQRVLLIGCALIAMTDLTLAQGTPDKTPKTPADKGVGRRIDNFKFTSLDGGNFALHDFKNKKAIVVFFLTFDCPVSNSYLAELSEMARSHKDTVFLGVCVSTDDPAQLKKQVDEFQVSFPVVQDAKLKAAGIFQARRHARGVCAGQRIHGALSRPDR